MKFPIPEGSLAETVLLMTAGLLLFWIGAGLSLMYCDWRHSVEVREVTHVLGDNLGEGLAVAKLCIGTMSEVVPGAFVAALQHPAAARSIMLSSQARDSLRDSLRERRWTSP